MLSKFFILTFIAIAKFFYAHLINYKLLITFQRIDVDLNEPVEIDELMKLRK